MSVAVTIAFTGLCALVGNGDGKPAHILLLDAHGVREEGGVPLPQHSPTLVVGLDDLANPDSSRPTRVVAGQRRASGRVEQLGMWDLSQSEVRIRAQGGAEAGLRFFQATSGHTSWPEPPRDVQDPGAWRDLRYVASMPTLVGDGRIDPELIAEDGTSSGPLPRSIAARIHLEAGLLQGALPSQATYRDSLFAFRSNGFEHGPRQALTDTIEWTFETDAGAVVIDIKPRNGGDPKRLLLAPSATPHRLFVSNLPAENVAHGEDHQPLRDEELNARHFSAYYQLLLNKPSVQPLPELWQPSSDEKGAGMLRPSFCPAAVFSRQ